MGFGFTVGVKMGDTITRSEAEKRLKEEVKIFESGVEGLLKAWTSQGHFDALVSFAFNAGLGALEESTLLSLHNDGDYTGAAEQFQRWIYGGGKVLQGLVRRRKAERELYLGL